MELPIQLLNEYAEPPVYGSAYAAGLDLRADLHKNDPMMTTLAPGERRLIKTGLAVAIPPGHYGRIAPRSGLALKYGIDVLAGVIDEDYRGEIGVILLNTSRIPFTVEHGDRIAQLVIEKIARPAPEYVDALPETGRGVGGFGSTGAT
ncbi:dUTP diphosphatase [Roseospira marina]|uniref:dUTP diphosphatase n=1 Tax=Roseospira marina TaxID=140057 RepID=A0A5M6I855_9PROT|nr:dUTP diphosphatase [Roseospira marina]KAA5604371.1 dUTP diphosphatase [Roseospira marina]MBB4315442.1 dUTP pyrophosphatase [Roseospira marina]MBB5088412.1 dUTP pyrophosphatase [Roseospira marina]